MSENRSFRINTNINKDSVVNVAMSQDIDCLEILSLKISQNDTYRLQSSNYGVIVGRVLANDGFGIPNAKVSVFIAVDDNDKENTEIVSIYPYTSMQERDKDKRRYNLLPDMSHDKCHRVIGTFPNKRLVLDNQTYLDIFDKYWKYTTVTNNAGDYMIFGVPVGVHTVHIDVDLSDIGILSQKPRDFYYKGYKETSFENASQFKKSSNLEDLVQVISQDKSVQVYPFWGDKDNADVIALSRCDLNLAYKFEPTCVFMGSIVTDDYSNSISHTCAGGKYTGYNERLTTSAGTIEMIRKTPEGGVEEYSIKGNELIDGNGVWCYQIPMNLDYIKTDEYGNAVPSDNPNEGIPTRTSVRFRISTNDTMNEGVGRHRAKYLVPNNLEFQMDGTNRLKDDGDYEKCFQYGSATPDKQFRNMYWNKIYSVKNYIPRIQTTNNAKTKNYSAIRSVNIGTNNNPLPFNKLRLHMSFTYIVLCILMTIVFRIVGFINKYIISPLREYLCVLPRDLGGGKKILWWRIPNWCLFKKIGLKCIDFTFGGVGMDGEDETYAPLCWSTEGDQLTSWQQLIDRLEQALAQEFKMVNLDFYNDWINGTLYMPLWFWRKVKKKKYLWGLFRKKAVNTFCNCDYAKSGTRLFELCAIPLTNDVTPLKPDNGEHPDKTKTSVRFDRGVIQEVTNRDGLNIYYYTPGLIYNKNTREYVQLYATDIILLGSFNKCDWDNLPNMTQYLPSTTANIPFLTTVRETLTDENSAFEGVIPGNSAINSVISGDNEGVGNSSDGTRDKTESSKVAEITGMDWTYETYNGTYKGGLFFDISCSKTKTMTKTCYNVRRLCELGVNLDATLYASLPDGSLGQYDEAHADADGLILYQEIDDTEARAMFATLNHNSLALSKLNPTTNYQSHFLYYLYPQNFDGSLNKVTPKLTKNTSLDVKDADYRKFRYGTYDSDFTISNIAKYNNQFPVFNNSFYFYFGLKSGETAIDKFRSLFDAPCINDKQYLYDAEIIKKASSVCEDNGAICITLSNAKLPYQIEIKDSTDDIMLFKAVELNEVDGSVKNTLTSLFNLDDDDIKHIYVKTLDVDEAIDMSNIIEKTVVLSGLSNDNYDIEIIDASENTIVERVSLYQEVSLVSMRGVSLVGKYDPLLSQQSSSSPQSDSSQNEYIITEANCGFLELYDIKIEGDEIIPTTLSPTLCVDEKNKFTLSGQTLSGEKRCLKCTLSFINDSTSVIDTSNFLIRDENSDVQTCYLEQIWKNSQDNSKTMGYKIKVKKSGRYTLTFQQLCIESSEPIGMKMKTITDVENGQAFTLYVNDVDTSIINWSGITESNQSTPWGFGAHRAYNYKLRNNTYSDTTYDEWKQYIDDLDEIGYFPMVPIQKTLNEIDIKSDVEKRLKYKTFDYQTLKSEIETLINAKENQEVYEKCCELAKNIKDIMGYFSGIIFSPYNELARIIKVDNFLNLTPTNNSFKKISNIIKPFDVYETMPSGLYPERQYEWFVRYYQNVLTYVFDIFCEEFNHLEFCIMLNAQMDKFISKIEPYNASVINLFELINDFFDSTDVSRETPLTYDDYVKEYKVRFNDMMANFTSLNSAFNSLYNLLTNLVTIQHTDKNGTVTKSMGQLDIKHDVINEIKSLMDDTNYYVSSILSNYTLVTADPVGERLERNALLIITQQLKDIGNIARGTFVTQESAQGFEITTEGGRGLKVIKTEYPNYGSKSLPSLDDEDKITEDNREKDVVHSIKTNFIDCTVSMPTYVMNNYITVYHPKIIINHQLNVDNGSGSTVNSLLLNKELRYDSVYKENPTALGNYISVVDNNGRDDSIYSCVSLPSGTKDAPFKLDNQMHDIIQIDTVQNFAKFDFVDRSIDYWIYALAPIPESLMKTQFKDVCGDDFEGDYKTYEEQLKEIIAPTLSYYKIEGDDAWAWDEDRAILFIFYLYFYYQDVILTSLKEELDEVDQEILTEINGIKTNLDTYFITKKLQVKSDFMSAVDELDMNGFNGFSLEKHYIAISTAELLYDNNYKRKNVDEVKNDIAAFYTSLYSIVRLLPKRTRDAMAKKQKPLLNNDGLLNLKLVEEFALQGATCRLYRYQIFNHMLVKIKTETIDYLTDSSNVETVFFQLFYKYAHNVAQYYYLSQSLIPFKGCIFGNIFNGIEMGYTHINAEDVEDLTYGEVQKLFSCLEDDLFVEDRYDGVKYFPSTKVVNGQMPAYKQIKDFKLLTNINRPLNSVMPTSDEVVQYFVELDAHIIKPQDLAYVEYEYFKDRYDIPTQIKWLSNFLSEYTMEYYCAEKNMNVTSIQTPLIVPTIEQIQEKIKECEELYENYKSQYQNIVRSPGTTATEKEAQIATLEDETNSSIAQMYNDTNLWRQQTYYRYLVLYDKFIYKIQEYLEFYNYNVISLESTSANTDYVYNIQHYSTNGKDSTLITDDKEIKLANEIKFELKDNQNSSNEVRQRFYDVELEVNDEKYHIKDYLGTNSEASDSWKGWRTLKNSQLVKNYLPEYNIQQTIFNTDGEGMAHSIVSDMFITNDCILFNQDIDINNKNIDWSNRLMSELPMYSGSSKSFGDIQIDGAIQQNYGTIKNIQIHNVPQTYQANLKIKGCSYHFSDEQVEIGENRALFMKTEQGEVCTCPIRLDYSDMYKRHRVTMNATLEFEVSPISINQEGDMTVKIRPNKSEYHNAAVYFDLYGDGGAYTQLPYLIPLNIFKSRYKDKDKNTLNLHSPFLDVQEKYKKMDEENQPYYALIDGKKPNPFEESNLLKTVEGFIQDPSIERDNIENFVDDSYLGNYTYISRGHDLTSSNIFVLVGRRFMHNMDDNGHLKMNVTECIFDVINYQYLDFRHDLVYDNKTLELKEIHLFFKVPSGAEVIDGYIERGSSHPIIPSGVTLTLKQIIRYEKYNLIEYQIEVTNGKIYLGDEKNGTCEFSFYVLYQYNNKTNESLLTRVKILPKK